MTAIEPNRLSPGTAGVRLCRGGYSRLRDNWLNPPNASEADLKDRTLTKLYNTRPEWLANAHRTLDAAVFAAYGWSDALSPGISDQEILSRLLAPNHLRASTQPS